MNALKLGELCAGYGGLGLAVEEALGAELAWYSEFDAAPSKIMATHWPDVPNHGDMTAIDWSAVEPVDIISGGTPCQDLSAAGRRKGMTEGTRSNLWVNMREAIATIKPKFVAWENVRGAYSAGADSDLEYCPGCMGADGGAREHVLRALGRVLGDLSDLGYDTQWRGLRAADVGAPHGRFRVFVLATRRDAAANPVGIGRNEAIERDGGEAQAIDRASVPYESDRDALRTRPHREAAGHSNDERSDRGGERAEEDWRGQSAHAGGIAAYAAGIRSGEHQQPRITGVPSAAWAGSAGNGGAEAAAKPTSIRGREGRAEYAREQGRPDAIERGASTEWGDYAPAIRRWEAVRGTAPAPTELTARGKHRLSARFAEWMMGIPAGWVTGESEEQWRDRISFRRLYGSKLPVGMRGSLARRGPFISRNEQLKAIGNGVVPQQALAALRDMLGHEMEEKVAA